MMRVAPIRSSRTDTRHPESGHPGNGHPGIGHRAGSRRLAHAALAACMLALAACSSSNEEVYVERPVESLYNAGVDAMMAENYTAASRLFDEVERQHPYSVWATKAKLMSAYSLYHVGNYDEAVFALDRFIDLHPGNRDAPYAYYLRALCYYEQISDVERDQRITGIALDLLEDLVRRFPDTEYARDAQLKLDLTYDHLAGKEMTVGRFYLRQGHYMAAINRFARVVEEYQTTTHTAEALHRLVEAYTRLGVHEEAERYASVLGHNFPGSDWYADSYYAVTDEDLRVQRERPGWMRRTWNWIF